MSDHPKRLEQIDIQSPCAVPWASMRGDEQVRFCGHCKQNVYDLSQMSRARGEALLRDRSGRLCVRMLRRDDGTVVTDECGPIRRKLRRRARAVHAAAVAFFAMFFPGALGGCGSSESPASPPIPTTGKPSVEPNPREILGERSAPTMGDAVVPTPPDAPRDAAPPAPPPTPAPPQPADGTHVIGKI